MVTRKTKYLNTVNWEMSNLHSQQGSYFKILHVNAEKIEKRHRSSEFSV